MKEAFKSYKVYIVTAILALLGYLPFIIAIFIYFFSTKFFETYPYVEWAIVAIYFLIGFVWGDQHSASWQRKTKNYDQNPPDDVKAESWKRRLPFFLAALLVAILCVTIEIIAINNANLYPFQG